MTHNAYQCVWSLASSLTTDAVPIYQNYGCVTALKSSAAVSDFLVGPAGAILTAENVISVQYSVLRSLVLNTMLSARQLIGWPSAPLDEGPFVLTVTSR